MHWKRQIVADMLQRLGGLQVKVHPVIGMDEPWSYRNKAQFPVADDNGSLKIGLFEKRSHKVVDVHECLIQHPLNWQAVEIARELIEKCQPKWNHQRGIPYRPCRGAHARPNRTGVSGGHCSG